ncbi:hypothetical protein Tco_1435766, partial [Tanacetum coccineum]
RKQVVAVGTPKAAEDASVVDEGAPAVPAPTKAPQPLPAAGPAKTMPQRMARRLGHTQLLDSAGATYIWYSKTHVPYQRHRVRQRTGEASTSAALLDKDQPDP